jgi:dienelactone hydrolase
MRLAILLVVVLAVSAVASADPLPKSLAPYFAPPKEYANDFGKYKSPLTFTDGTPVRTADDWKKRREEIRQSWHDLLGPWPPPIEKPTLEVLSSSKRENFTQQHVRVQVAPDRTTDDARLLIPEGKGPFPAVLVVFYDSKTGIGEGTKSLRDFAYQLAKRGFVALSLGSHYETYWPNKETCKLQPLSYHAYEAATCRTLLAQHPSVDRKRIGIVGHSYGGKWAMFASCLNDDFAAAAWSDGGVVFDESRPNVNYWEPWYLGFERGKDRKRGVLTKEFPRQGPYKTLVESGRDLHELHALMAPRPFLVSGGSEDPPERWRALNHAVVVNKLLGFENRVGMTNRKTHDPTEESNARLYEFFKWALGR